MRGKEHPSFPSAKDLPPAHTYPGRGTEMIPPLK
jgi:hypothetical protein